MADFNFDPSLTGGAGEYMGTVGGLDIGPQPTYTTTPVSAPVSFAPTETGYTPTFDFASYFPYVPPQFGYEQPGGGFAVDPLPEVRGRTFDQAALNAFAGPGARVAPRTQTGVTTTTPGAVDPFAAVRGEEAALRDRKVAGEEAPQDQGFIEKTLSKMSGGDIIKLLTGGVGGLMSYLGAQKAQQQAADAAAEYRQAAQKAATDLRGTVAPLLNVASPMLGMGQVGALTPAFLQSYQAASARAAQEAARGGGAAGAAQIAATEQRMYNDALTAQLDAATKLYAQIDPVLADAINAELKGVQGGLDFELRYGAQAATALGNMMASLGGTVGRTA